MVSTCGNPVRREKPINLMVFRTCSIFIIIMINNNYYYYYYFLFEAKHGDPEPRLPRRCEGHECRSLSRETMRWVVHLTLVWLDTLMTAGYQT